MPSSAVGQLSSQRAISYVFCGWLLFVSTSMVMAGHHPLESAGAATIVALQLTAGFVLWQVISNGSTREIVGATAMGAVFGAVLATLSGIVFVGTPIAPVGWVLPVAVSMLVARRLRPVAQTAPSTITWLLAATLLGLSTEWTWLFPTAIGVALVAGRRHLHRVLLGSMLVALSAVQGWFLSVRSNYWSQFRQGLTEVGDYVYLEAVARGSAQWAQTDNILASGERLGYHWLSYAWAGRVTEVVDATSMAFSSHIIQITFVAASVGLVFAVSVSLGASEGWALFGSLMVAMWVGVPIGLFQALAVLSPSQPFVVAAILGTLLYLSLSRQLPLWKSALLAMPFVVGVVGGKASAVPAVTAAIGLLIVWQFFCSGRRNVLSLAVAASTVVGGFLFFYGGVVSDGTTGSTQLKFLEVAFTEGPVSHVDRPMWLAIVGSVAILAGVVALVPGLIVARSLFAGSNSTLAWLLLVSAIASFVVGFVYVGERSGVLYFFNVGIALLAPLSVAASSRFDLPPISKKWVAGLFCSVLIGVLLPNLIIRVSDSGVTPSLARSGLLLVPLAVAGVVYRCSNVKSFVGPILLASVMGISSYFAWVPRYAFVQIRNGIAYESSVDSVSGSAEQRLAAEWLRENSASGDVVATNRFCSNHTEQFPNCFAYWNVVSSIAGRRMFLENAGVAARSVSGVLERALQSVEFVDRPSEKSVEFLATANVSWVFVDRSVTTTMSWEPWAEVVFENEDAYILRVLGSTGMP